MKWLFVFLFLGVSAPADAQQLLCERVLSFAPAQRYFTAAGLVAGPLDSVRLLADYWPAGSVSGVPAFTRPQQLNVSTCDTVPGSLPTPASPAGGSAFTPSISRVVRGGQLLVATGAVGGRALSGDTVRVRVTLFSRNGQRRWSRVLPAWQAQDRPLGLVDAPGSGFYLCSAGSLIRLDSLGHLLWRRTYRNVGELHSPVYTAAGTLLVHLLYNPGPATPGITTGVLEVTQGGDSLTTRRVTPDPQQVSIVDPVRDPETLLPLRDGGFALVGLVDSAATGYYRPFLARLDRNLTVLWTYTYRSPTAQGFYFTHPCELADGTLVVLANSALSGRSLPYWLFRFSAAGSLQPRYAFASQALPPNVNQFTGTFGRATGLRPLRDSSFVLVSSFTNAPGTRLTYLAHLRVPGLPRVIDAHYVPAATPLAVQPGRGAGAGLELYPNPAGGHVMVRYAGAPPATLVLTDLLGRRVYVGALSPVETQISLSTLPPGLYQATVWAKGQLLATGRLAVIR